MISKSNNTTGRPAGAARPLFYWLAVLFVLGAVVEFFLAGLGVFETQRLGTTAGSRLTKHAFNNNFGPHILLGSILVVLAIALVLVALVARLERRMKLMSLGLFVLIAIQAALADSGPPALRALHPVLGVAALGLGVHLVLTARRKQPATPALS
ncbi:MAG TPA: DUF6220 domain-containing protein [Acidimicrobiales bacterium]|nr:DUF6220 domain-containing protein [Acidimicrobiales bacterium]